ncbi:thiamine pyrophosphate-binding protein [Halorussus marinus]|uniref:thiamine pyrophosphate-binding protein n=1 Tax=Halorussus marinus TaxID=2505976 RepID=UPI001091ECD7|nr:thiamine pyrophosphate-binding protein [Halorussus marinus]
MPRTGADLFLDALDQYGVSKLFGNPGTTELPVVHALPDTGIDYVLGLHEDVAVGMAAGYASTRRQHADVDPDVLPLGVVNLHVAPGLAHGLGNLYGAEFAGAPLLVTAGNYSTDFQHEEPILHGDVAEMAEPFTKWSAEVTDVEALPTMLRRAVRVALTPPTGPVFLGLPANVMRDETDDAPERLGAIPDAGAGDPEQVAAAADAIVDADEPVFVLGDAIARSGSDAVESATRLAEVSGARVHGEYITSEVNMPTGHEQWVSSFPGDGDAVAELTDGADVLLLVGRSTDTTSFKYAGERLPSDATLVHVSDDAWEVGKNEPADVAVVGDPGRILGAIADDVAGRVDDAERERRLARVREVSDSVGGSDESPPADGPATKTQLAEAIRNATDDALVVNEAVTSGIALRREMDFEAEGYLSNKSGGLGYGLPAAVGAAMAETEAGGDRDVIGFVGDGSYLYYPQTLYSAARYDVDLTVVVANNGNYRILKDNTLRMLGGEESDYEFTGMDFDPGVDFAANAESHGATAHRAESPDEIEATIREAVDAAGPSVVDALIRD